MRASFSEATLRHKNDGSVNFYIPNIAGCDIAPGRQIDKSGRFFSYGGPVRPYVRKMSAPSAENELSIPLPDEAATERLGARLGALLQPGDFVSLSGDLGAGKTALARAAVRARLGDWQEEVPSPTFTLVQTYEAPDLLITHVDLYRLDRPEDAAELGLGDALDEGALLVEWPDRLGRLPQDRLDISIRLVGEGGAREAHLTGHGQWAARLRELHDPLAGLKDE